MELEFGMQFKLRSPTMADLQNYFYLAVSLVSFIFVIIFRAFRRPRHRLPPGPIPFPIIGHFHLLGPKLHKSLQKLSHRYGPLVQLFLGSNPCLVVASPELVKEFLQTHDVTFSNHPKRLYGNIISYGAADLAFAPYGPRWRFIKKVCMTSVLSTHTLIQFEPSRREERNLFLQALLEKAKAGEAVDVRDEILKLTNNVASRMTMNQRCTEHDSEAARVRSCISVMSRLAGKLNWADYLWFLKNLDVQGDRKRTVAAHHKFDMMMERVLKEHEEERSKKEAGEGGGELKDLVHILLDLLMEDKNGEMKLTRDNVKGILLDVFGGATESPANAMVWAVAELINNPNLLEKARHEIESIIGKDRLVEESDIPNLPYIQAIVKETLRLHPSFTVLSRLSSEDCTVAGYHIPANTELLVNVWAMERDPNYWENPLEFSPSRFLNEDRSIKKGLDVKGQQFLLLPFGTGRRTCPGASLTLQLLHSTIATVIQCFDWKVGNGGNGSINMEEGHGSSRAHPLICVPVARFNPFLTHAG